VVGYVTEYMLIYKMQANCKPVAYHQGW